MAQAGPEPRVVLIGKPGCHLCDVARQVVEIVCAEADLDFADLSIYDDPFLAAEYADAIPVVLVDQREVARFRINPASLRQALTRPTPHPPPPPGSATKAAPEVTGIRNIGPWR